MRRLIILETLPNGIQNVRAENYGLIPHINYQLVAEDLRNFLLKGLQMQGQLPVPTPTNIPTSIPSENVDNLTNEEQKKAIDTAINELLEKRNKLN